MNEQILLKKIIKKIIKGGFDKDSANDFLEVYERAKPAHKECYITTLIFSHDFAKAYWGEEDYTDGKTVFANWKAWQYHLQQMVLIPQKKRLKYLEEFLKK